MNPMQSFRTMFRRRTDLNEELQSHLRMAIADRVAQGESPAAAKRAVLREFGNVALVADVTREGWGWMGLERLCADTVFGWRQLRKRKVTTAAAVLSLALAIGSCMTAFRLVDALFLRPLAVEHPDRLYEISYGSFDDKGNAITYDTNSYGEFMRMRDAVKGQAELVAISTQWFNEVTFNGEMTQHVHQQYVSGWAFPTFGLQPAAGRLFTADDDRAPKQRPYAVLAYDFWAAHFGRDPHVVGRTFRMENVVYEVIGVAPRGFRGTGPGVVTDIYLPMMMNQMTGMENVQWFRIFVQVNPGVNLTLLADKLHAADQSWKRDFIAGMAKKNPHLSKKFSDRILNATLSLVHARSGVSQLQKDYGKPLLVLSVLVLMVMLIACVNVANLMSGQAAARAREMAVRVSLGAGRGRLIRLVMVESAMVGSIAAALGILFSCWATPFVVRRIHPMNNPVPLWIGPDWMVLVFAVALAIGVTVFFGLIPAMRASRVQPVNALKGGADPKAGVTGMQGLIAAQVAICIFVLFAGGLFVGTLVQLTNQPMGFSIDRLVTLDVVAKEPATPAKWEQVADGLRQVPGVERVATEFFPLLSGGVMNGFITANNIFWNNTPTFFFPVSPGWLETMRIPLVAGRDLRAEDVDPGNVIVNETFAKTYFSGANPIGKSFEMDSNSKPGKTNLYQIVGVSGDAVYTELRSPKQPVVYKSENNTEQNELSKFKYLSFEVKTKGDPQAMMATLQTALPKIDPAFNIGQEIQLHSQFVEAQTLKERLLASLAGFFAVVALLLAVIGLYGVLHYSVVQREKEIGIRIALGAATAHVARVVTGRVFVMVLLGAAVGLAAGAASVRFVSTLLYGVKGTDASMIALPTVLLLITAALAATPAVLRATRIDPATMLRSE